MVGSDRVFTGVDEWDAPQTSSRGPQALECSGRRRRPHETGPGSLHEWCGQRVPTPSRQPNDIALVDQMAPGQLNVLPNVVAPNPRLVADAVGPFLRARTRVLQASGVDYLGRLADVFRGVSYETSKPGVASMSWHKAGRAIDVAQAFNVKGVEGVVFVRDAASPRYYRVLIRCAKQDGSLGNYYGPSHLEHGKDFIPMSRRSCWMKAFNASRLKVVFRKHGITSTVTGLHGPRP